MKAVITDTQALRALKPLEVAAYLRARGWQRAHDDALAIVWTSHDADVRLPSDERFADYPLRMSELLTAVARSEGRSELEVLQDMFAVQADLVRVRAIGLGAAAGTLPLDQGVAFVERSRDMVLAAACASINKRPFFARRKPQRAMDYLRSVRLGQTEHGSYVLTLLSPVPPQLTPAQGTLLPTEPVEPYERVVMRTLVDGLQALSGAVRQAAIAGNMAPFTAAVERGVSANLCDAVAGLSRVTEGQIAVDVAWSLSRPVAGEPPQRIQISRDAVPILDEASRLLQESAPIEDFELEGMVTRLHRGTDAADGDVTIMAFVEGQPKSVVATLAAENYRRASTAHGDRLPVKLVGELVREGRGFRLANPRRFEVLSTDANLVVP